MKAKRNYNRLGLRQIAFVMVQALFSKKEAFIGFPSTIQEPIKGKIYQRKLIADNL